MKKLNTQTASPIPLLILIFVSLFVISGCIHDKSSDNTKAQNQPLLKTADTNEAFEENIKTYLIEMMEEQSAIDNTIPVTDISSPIKEANPAPTTGSADSSAADGSASASPPASSAPASGGGGGGSNSSGTNLVEKKVDESDLVKSDGKHLLIGRQPVYEYNNLPVLGGGVEPGSSRPVEASGDIAIFPPEYYEPILKEAALIRIMKLDNNTPSSKEISQIKLPASVTQILGLYFSKMSTDATADQLIVITRVRPQITENFYQENNSRIFSYNISNPETPEKQWQMEIEGYYHASRSMNGKLYIVSSKYLRLQNIKGFVSGENTFEDNKKLVENLTMEDILPTTWVNEQTLPIVQPDLCLVPDKVSSNRVIRPSLLTVYTIPVDQPENTQSLCTVESSAEVYVSPNAIYFTKGEYAFNESQPQQSKSYTVIHKLRFTQDNVAYTGSIRIPGWTGWRNRAFRMSEFNNDLRVVVSDFEFSQREVPVDPIKPLPIEFILVEPVFTEPAVVEVTSSNFSFAQAVADSVNISSQEPITESVDEFIKEDTETQVSLPETRIIVERRLVNKLFVIRESSDSPGLKIVSQLPNAEHPESIDKPNEDIYAVRFFNQYAYVVTFRRTDPLYAINLKDPENPFIEGKLNIPGFSEYLHPINENLLLGVGKQADDSGRVKGLKIALFNIADKSNPETINEIKVGNAGSNTALSYDYKAFAILPDTDTGIHRITVPVNIFNQENISPSNHVYYSWSYSGLQLAEIDDGTISGTPDLVDAGVLKAFERSKDELYHYVYRPRGLIAGDAVYYIENSLVWSAKWDSPDDVNGPN